MTFIRNNFGSLCLGLLVVVAIGGILKWSDWHDAQMQIAYSKYEVCVKAQYHTTPQAYYAEHGVAPDCE